MRIDVKTLQVFIDTMVGVPKFSYPAKMNAPKPAEEFAHIALLNEHQVGIPRQDILSSTSETTTYRYYSAALLRFRVGIIETDGIKSTKIMHGWTSEAIKSLMIATGYGFVRCLPVAIEDAKLEKIWETRQGFTIDMYATRTYDEVVDNITAMTISGCYINDAMEEVLLNFNINE